jgi:hypothetical protein
VARHRWRRACPRPPYARPSPAASCGIQHRLVVVDVCGPEAVRPGRVPHHVKARMTNVRTPPRHAWGIRAPMSSTQAHGLSCAHIRDATKWPRHLPHICHVICHPVATMKVPSSGNPWCASQQILPLGGHKSKTGKPPPMRMYVCMYVCLHLRLQASPKKIFVESSEMQLSLSVKESQILRRCI